MYFSFFHSSLSEKCLIISHSVTPVHQLARRNRRALKNQGLFSLESKKKNLHHHEKVEEVAGSSGGPLKLNVKIEKSKEYNILKHSAERTCAGMGCYVLSGLLL